MIAFDVVLAVIQILNNDNRVSCSYLCFKYIYAEAIELDSEN